MVKTVSQLPPEDSDQYFSKLGSLTIFQIISVPVKNAEKFLDRVLLKSLGPANVASVLLTTTPGDSDVHSSLRTTGSCAAKSAIHRRLSDLMTPTEVRSGQGEGMG